MPKIDYSFHTHTFRCGHAVGTDEEYVKAAVKQGYRYFGFSDHVMLPGIEHRIGIRGDYDLYYADYIRSIRELREKYKEHFDIQIGFECEWLGEGYGEYYRSILEKGDVDYLIQGQHCFMIGKRLMLYGNLFDYKVARKAYVEDLIAGMESGLFLYVAHPDYIFHYGQERTEEDVQAAREILQAAERLDIPLEINMGPSRWDHGRKDEEGDWLLIYPQKWFWDLAKEYDISVCVGPDVHDPNEILTSDYDWAVNFALSRGLKLLSGKDLYERIKKHR